MCRILYLVGQLGTGGLERQLYYLLLGMNREVYKPAVAVWNYCETDPHVHRIRALGVPVYPLARNKSRYSKLLALRRLIVELKAEIVHSYSFFTNFGAWSCSLGSPAIPIGSIRQNFLNERMVTGRFLGRLSARWPAVQICNSLAAKISVEQTKGPFTPRRLYVVRNGLDMTTHPEPSLFPSKPVLLALGRLYPEKRWDRLIKVIAMVHKTGIPFRVLHAGMGPLAEDLKAQASRMGVDDIIEFLGLRHDTTALLSQSAFLIHTADDEGCPNVVMEAMACSRAVVATDAGDVARLVEDGSTGFVVRRGDDESLASRIVTLLTNPMLCKQMGKNGRAKALREFGLQSLVSGTLAVYKAEGWSDVQDRVQPCNQESWVVCGKE
jgi:glycosyltransferase involved in cell wall biosynthesis